MKIIFIMLKKNFFLVLYMQCSTHDTVSEVAVHRNVDKWTQSLT